MPGIRATGCQCRGQGLTVSDQKILIEIKVPTLSWVTTPAAFAIHFPVRDKPLESLDEIYQSTGAGLSDDGLSCMDKC